MPVLLCRHLDRRIDWKVVVDDPDFTVGCSESATVPVPDETLAPREARITRKGERYLLQDLAEKGRVVLGGAVTRTGLLKDGDRFRIGRISILFLEHPKSTAGQVDLLREIAPSFDLLESAASAPVVKRNEPLLPDEPEIPRGVWAGVLILAVFSGLSLGILVWGPPRDTRAASETVTKDNGASETPGGASKTNGLSIDSAIAKAKEQAARLKLSDSPNGQAATPLSATEEPNRNAASGSASVSTPGASATPQPTVAKISPPARFTLTPILEPRGSRLALFRLFIDVAGRPPTRGEEAELLPLDHEGRWKRISDAAVRDGTSVDPKLSVEAQFFNLIGRRPSTVEAQEITDAVTQERRAAFWITALEEYRRPDRRRPRSAAVRARSLIVDLLDRPPGNEKETETVRAALPESGSALEAARTLVHSARGHQASGPDAGGDWESEVFRFLLRDPTPAERKEVASTWERLDPAQRRSSLFLALASHEDYAKY